MGRLIAVVLFALAATAAQAAPLRIVVDLTPKGARGAFRPDEALGAGVDGAQKGEIDRLLTPKNVTAMRSLGLRSLTYRLRTELGIEAWHWTEDGTWSDPARKQGYFTGNARTTRPISLSWGYQLPRRGDTLDNANNTGWSRLTDGDPATFWKSNPYLDPRYTHERRERPQWLIVRLDEARPVDAVRIDWATPYATAYQVQHWTGEDDYDPDGRWITFPDGDVRSARGGTETRRLVERPIKARFLRILLLRSSHTAPRGSTDVRDRLGYAVGEVGFGTLDRGGRFHDLARHAASHDDQTFTHVSSTDPWHRAVDRDPNLEQAGLDRIYASGLTNGLPMMLPVPVLFDTPENAAALMAYVKRRGFPVARVELGEEPDGQFGDPADYGALYLEVLDIIKRVGPGFVYGGPSMQSAATDRLFVDQAHHSWNAGFIAYLKSRKQLKSLQFFSFEHYPFDDICGDIHGKLIDEDALLSGMLKRLADEGVPRTTPLIISEYGFSAFSGQAMVEMPSALLQADIVGHFLSAGGQAAYMFGYGPNVPINQHLPCAGYGNMAPFLADANGQAGPPLPQAFASRLISQVWLQPGHGLHRLHAAEVEDQARSPGPVIAYPVTRPDGRLAVMILNRSADRAASVRLVARKTGEERPLSGPAEVWRYGPEQYRWRADGLNGHPVRDEPPARSTAPAGDDLVLPPDTMMVVVARP